MFVRVFPLSKLHV